MRILISGDFCPRERVADNIERGDFATVFGEVKEITNNTDYAIVNLECPVVEHEAKPIDKCGPNLKCTSKAVEALRWAGFNCVTLANNHFLDFGETGVKDTLEACQSCGLDYVGGGNDINEASQILYKEIKGKKLAIINCCEHEFSIATVNRGGSNPLNLVKQYYAIQEARLKADHVLVIIHGGIELFWLPSERMIETYRFFIDAGADAVVNHHQHCYSGYEEYKGKPIFYGLGNFCFDWFPEDYRWTSGYMALISFDDNSHVQYDIIPYRQCTEKLGVSVLHNEEKDQLISIVKDYNSTISDDDKREQEYKKWCVEKSGMYKTALNPALNRYTSWMFRGAFGKRLISKKKLLQTLDYLVNESHIERLRQYVESECEKK